MGGIGMNAFSIKRDGFSHYAKIVDRDEFIRLLRTEITGRTIESITYLNYFEERKLGSEVQSIIRGKSVKKTTIKEYYEGLLDLLKEDPNKGYLQGLPFIDMYIQQQTPIFYVSTNCPILKSKLQDHGFSELGTPEPVPHPIDEVVGVLQ